MREHITNSVENLNEGMAKMSRAKRRESKGFDLFFPLHIAFHEYQRGGNVLNLHESNKFFFSFHFLFLLFLYLK